MPKSMLAFRLGGLLLLAAIAASAASGFWLSIENIFELEAVRDEDRDAAALDRRLLGRVVQLRERRRRLAMVRAGGRLWDDAADVERDLLRELLGREDSVEERFAAELDCAGDELGFRIGEEYVSQFVPPADPAIVAVKSELRSLEGWLWM